jgi:hypothetical protein
MILASPGKNARCYLKNNKSKKELGTWLKRRALA